MKKKQALIIILIGSAIILLGYYLRLKMFSSFPAIGDTQDEIKYAFNGLSLIKEGVPQSWSWREEYGNFPIVKIRNNPYRLVKPYFDNPPLFALIMGQSFVLSSPLPLAENFLITLSLAALLSFQKAKNKLHRLIPLATLGSCLVFFTIMSGPSKGWYRFPFYPFLSWAMATISLQPIKRPKFFSFFFFLTIPFFSSYSSGTGEFLVLAKL